MIRIEFQIEEKNDATDGVDGRDKNESPTEEGQLLHFDHMQTDSVPAKFRTDVIVHFLHVYAIISNRNSWKHPQWVSAFSVYHTIRKHS